MADSLNRLPDTWAVAKFGSQPLLQLCSYLLAVVAGQAVHNPALRPSMGAELAADALLHFRHGIIKLCLLLDNLVSACPCVPPSGAPQQRKQGGCMIKPLSSLAHQSMASAFHTSARLDTSTELCACDAALDGEGKDRKGYTYHMKSFLALWQGPDIVHHGTGS